MSLEKKTIKSRINSPRQSIHQGDCVHIRDDQDLFQVIGIDNSHQKCWVRRWPLLPHGSPVFEISVKQIVSSS